MERISTRLTTTSALAQGRSPLRCAIARISAIALLLPASALAQQYTDMDLSDQIGVQEAVLSQPEDFKDALNGGAEDAYAKIAAAYTDHRGHSLVLLGDRYSQSPNWHWLNGDALYKLQITAHASETADDGVIERARVNFLDPRAAADGAAGEYTIEKDNLTLSCGNDTARYEAVSSDELTTIARDISSGRMEKIPLPPIRRPQYLFNIDGTDQYLYVDADTAEREGSTSHADYRLFIGKPGKWKKLEVKSYGRLLDGGFVVAVARGGVLRTPGVFSNGRGAIWQPSRNAQLIELVSVARELENLAALGLQDVRIPTLHTPCDSLLSKN